MLSVQEFLDCSPDLCKLSRWQFNGAVDAIKYPSQNFFLEGPDSFLLELLERDGLPVGVGVARRWRWENGVDGVQESTGMVEQDIRVGALDSPGKIINIDLKQGIEVLDPFWEFF